MRTRRWIGVAGLVAVTLSGALSGCSWVDAGTKVEEEFTEEFMAEHREHTVELRVIARNDMPGAGGASAIAVLAPDTSPEDFAAALADLESFEPSRGYFTPMGVIANGVGVCAGDPQLEAKQALRDALHAQGVSLAGEWGCPSAQSQEQPPYLGTLADLDADLDTVATVGGAPALRLEASVKEPSGRLSGALDEVPDSVAEVVTAVADLEDVVRFEFVDGDLQIAITPTADPAPAQAAADAAAGGDLAVTVLLGSLDAGEHEHYAAVGPLLDELREIPGVSEVRTNGWSVMLRTDDPQQVTAIHDAAVAHPEFADLSLELHVGGRTDETRQSAYTRPVGAQSEGIGIFAELVTHPAITKAVVREANDSQSRWVRVTLAGPITDVGRLREVLPLGLEVEVTSDADHRTVRFTTAEQLTADDLSSVQVNLDLEPIAQAWNVAG